MATTIMCDKCGEPVARGFRVTLIGVTDAEFGDVDVTGEFCGVTCLAQHLGALRGSRPDFDRAHAQVEKARVGAKPVCDVAEYVASLDDVEPPPVDEFEGEPVDITALLVHKHAQGKSKPYAASFASRAADAVAEQTAARS